MSRQAKKRNQRRVRNSVVYALNDKGQPTGKRIKGPARTEPKHGKVNRLPYDGRKRRRVGA